MESHEMEKNKKSYDSESPSDQNEKAGVTPVESHSGDETLSFERSALAALEDQVKEKENKYIYLYAEFENFKKRSIKERSELIKFGWESVARDLLQCIDNLDRVLTYLPEDADKNFVEGFKMTIDHFISTLQKQGVKPIECVGQPFDPNFHEAVGEVPSDLPQGTIVNELLRGYTLHGRLLRAARVQVSAGKNEDKKSS